MLLYTEEEIAVKWIFKQYNDPKNTSRKLKEIETKAVSSAKSNKEELWLTIEAAWKITALERYYNLIDSVLQCARQIYKKYRVWKY